MSKDFFDVIKQGDRSEVERLLSQDSTLIHRKENGLSPIMVAVYSQKPEIAEFLSEKVGNLSIFESTALGRTNQIARHLARDPMLANACACDGYQPLGLASLFGRYDAAVYLIKAGAVVNTSSRNWLDATPLHSATTAGHLNIVLLLLNHDANPNAKDGNSFTPLHIAAQKGFTSILRSLLFNGADLTIQTRQGKLPLDIAHEADQMEAAALLKEGITRRFKALRPIIENQ
jgi:ankyrin repeat protein